jgi:hypothetical protein
MDRMDLDPVGKRKHPDIYDSSPAASPLHPAKRSKVAHAPDQTANVPPKASHDSDTSSNSNGINAAAPGAQQPAHPPKDTEGEVPQSPAADDLDGSGSEDPPLPEPVVHFADLTVDAEARIRAKDAARERERVRLSDTRRKRSDTTRSLLDSPHGDGEGEGEAGAASTGEGVDTGGPVREGGIGRGEDEDRPVKKRRKGEASQEQSEDGRTGMPREKPKDLPEEESREMPQNKSEDMPREEQQKPVGPQITPPPEKPKGDGVGAAQSDGKPRSPEPRSRKRSSDEALEALEAEDLAGTAQEDALRNRRRKRRRDARTDEM